MSTPTSPSRRQFIQRVGLVAGAAALPLAVHEALAGNPAPAATAAAVGSVQPSANFHDLASVLTGHSVPDPVLVQRVYAALAQAHHDLDAQVSALLKQVQGMQGQSFEQVDMKKANPLHAEIMSGLYLGVIGPWSARQCVAFENTQSYQEVSSFLQPPSYCTGEPNFWVKPPATTV